MSHYPEVVEKIVQDYLQRVAIQLKRFPNSDQKEVLKELGSHIYESYCAESDSEPVGRTLEVLRKLGEPADVVAEKLRESWLNVRRLKNFPLSVLGGIVVGMFGLPLGFAGVAMLLGGLGAMLGLVAAFFATATLLLVTGVMGMGLGLLRMFNPDLWDHLVAQGFIQFHGRIGQFFDLLSPATQGGLLVFLFMAVAAAGLGMLWLSKRLLKGLRFLFDLMLDRARTLFRRSRHHGFAGDGSPVKSPVREVPSDEEPISGSTSYSPIR
jgi:uncharacterized membrane protein